ncbi:tRNA (adenosine(37)-N6)-threonylcarbamoyltransferase complex ATPase subunit type 1 TsaE [Streptomonospora nanhaiensis]|uniref:tRNA threonylcarbamoyladenosine biosynthesis protein TsaE n=1 Tax=Streptomonospora nanhaiensis TaxID=1323731 RepID=A0A853BPI4_9ACTN|nr:tRNA (adenosine(37)-N6)-threonylcarbamoyltransferase complex ATPase subunit type 1 TsaE [Streptomonospora nanhaiensis]MBX9387223.1 tRNA (adenosine(37)-N6)-threonylcarbamoyltransferase complex ATPase subunit type 1 TsaE [Streptomonospora nanhaiensis]NYI97569.1 tRNA threonylcarbamoyladenosine biosynthesis protein TsaE [Streptomonospora nanhaiensis]
MTETTRPAADAAADPGARAPAGTAFVTADTDAAMRALGRHIAGLLRPGDLLILSGPLGAGKTTLTQGIGEGLGVRGPITSPTFVISRVHPPLAGGPPLVHVDAYRLGGSAEVDDLDLDSSLADSVTVVEWGEGVAEELAEDRLEITIARHPDDTRGITLTGIGARWADVALRPE